MRCRSKNAGPKNSHYVARGTNGEKRCSRCLTYKPLDAFDVDRSRYDGRAYICIACRRSPRPGPSRAERREHELLGLGWCIRCAAWTAPPRRSYCQPHANEGLRERYACDPEFRERRQRRALGRRSGVDAIPIEGQDAILDLFEGLCAYCLAPATTWDHVVAIAAGGTTEPSNMVPACRSCNSSKRDSNLWEWLDRTGRVPHEMLECRLLLHHQYVAQSPDPFE